MGLLPHDWQALGELLRTSLDRRLTKTEEHELRTIISRYRENLRKLPYEELVQQGYFIWGLRTLFRPDPPPRHGAQRFRP